MAFQYLIVVNGLNLKRSPQAPLASIETVVALKTAEILLIPHWNNSPGDATGLAWGDGSTPGAPKIIYASRTHSQLGQVIAELKRSSYRYMKVRDVPLDEARCSI